jgi:hypothetical protein
VSTPAQERPPPPPPFYRFPPFSASVADAFVGGTELDSGGSARLSLHVLLASFARIAALTAPHDAAIARALARVAPMLSSALALATDAADVKDAASFERFVATSVAQRVADSLAHNAPLLVVGGWKGLESEATLMHVLELSGATASFGTLATGAGLEYHPMTPCDTPLTPPKVKYASVLRVDDVPVARVRDPGFWAVLLAQWLRADGSEYHRVEMVYDVLLPWLVAPRALAAAAADAARADPAIVFRTPQRSGTDAWRAVVEAFRYCLCRFGGLTQLQWKRVSLALHQALLERAAQDVVARLARHVTPQTPALAAAIGALPAVVRDAPAADADDVLQLTATDCRVLRFASEHMAKCAVKAHAASLIDDAALHGTRLQLEALEALVQLLPREASSTGGLPPTLQASLTTVSQPYPGCHLLAEKSDESRAGAPAAVPAPKLADLLAVPARVRTFEEAVGALVRTDGAVEELVARTRDTTTSSRLQLQLQALALIDELFVRVLPTPIAAGSTRAEQCMWRGASVLRQLQQVALQRIHHLTLVYAALWQVVERPTRAHDAQRSLSALCQLAVFDAVVRVRAVDGALLLSDLMWDEGGFRVATERCQNHRALTTVAATMQLLDPSALVARAAVLEYFADQERTCRHAIYDLRQPDKIEIRKHGATVLFLRRFMERAGFELIPRNSPNRPSEIEALAHWLCSDRTALADEHPEFHALRDVAALCKFLGTMETRETEQMRRRHAAREYQPWRLSFDDAAQSRRAFFAASHDAAQPLLWEATNFRGQDLSIADVRIVAFGDRELLFGEGPVVQSPIDAAKLIGAPLPSEDDVLHADALPDFGQTLSREETEQLLSFLTVDYLRVPLVLGFFAAHDRVTYLFNEQLRDVLRAALFEPAAFCAEHERQLVITRIPVRRTALQQRQLDIDKRMFADPNDERTRDELRALGTSHGLLLNELRYAPAAVLEPLQTMLGAVEPLAGSSVHSLDASFVLFLIELAIDVHVFVRHVLDTASDASELLRALERPLHAFLHGTAAAILNRWLAEAEAANDLASASCVHAYKALLWSGVAEAQIDVAALLGSVAFVRNWHGFGMGQNRSDLLWDSPDALSEPQSRLLRFLQAQGIDTSRMTKESLETYMSDASKPLFLHVGRDVIRAPRLIRASDVDVTRLPPADVPEWRLFELMQRKRRVVVARLAALPAAELDGVLRAVVRTALRADDFDYRGWTQLPVGGRYSAKEAALTLDAQSGELLWRNDALKPVPDSMSRFGDFEALFGRQTLHVGVVRRQEHRFWVHVVGTAFDLQEWDKPPHDEQGVGVPRALPADPDPVAAAAASSALTSMCLRCGAIGRCWACEACTYVHCSGNMAPTAPCQMCGRPKGGPQAAEQAQPQRRRRPGEEAEAPPAPPIERAEYNGVRFDRKFDPYSEAPHEHASEQWAVELLKPVLLAAYPPEPAESRMPYPALWPRAPLADGASVARLIGCDSVGKPDATWKEFVLLRHRRVLLVFNVVSHGRRMFRSLVYASDARFSLHSLPPSLGNKASRVSALRNAAGDLKKRRTADESLVIVRRNATLGGNETYVPPRLLQGIVPSVLLEAFRFWQGDDQMLRGEPLQDEGEWFGYRIEMSLAESDDVDSRDWVATVVRRPLSAPVTPIATGDAAVRAVNAQQLQRSTSIDQIATMTAADDEADRLMLLGFSRAACRIAMRRNDNDSDAAASWLLDESNLPEILAAGMFEDEQAPAHVASSSTSNSAGGGGGGGGVSSADALPTMSVDQPPQSPLSSLPASLASSMLFDAKDGGAAQVADLTLLNLLDTPAHEGTDSALHRLATLLSRIEDLSHVLCWTTSVGAATRMRMSASASDLMALDSELCSISVIELPRLKLRLQPQRVDGGASVRLCLLDHAGWFVSDAGEHRDTRPGMRSLDELLSGIEQCLLVENDAGELAILVPNHDMYRPRVRGEPFSVELVGDRSSMGWQSVMDSRYYMYSVHTSNTFLHAPTLAARLYLCVLFLLSRQYARVFALLEACDIDTDFTSEEKWVFGQLARAADDFHPDAHACRLRATLAVLHSDNEQPWQTHVELDQYLAKLPHVSAQCRLALEDELALLYHCKVATPALKYRLECLRAEAAGAATVLLQPKAPRAGGQPWFKLQQLSMRYIEQYGVSLTTLRYRPPPQEPMASDKVAAMLWDDDLLSDEESGANRQLGFLFVYELVTRRRGLRLCDQDCTATLGELLARAFHLKLVRWGKEAVGDGEIELVVSPQLATVAAVLTEPQRAWPAVPRDAPSARMLDAGLNVYSPQGRQSNVKVFLDLLHAELQQTLTSPAREQRVALLRDMIAAARLAATAPERSVDAAAAAGALRWPAAPQLSDTARESARLTPTDGVVSAAEVAAFSGVPLSNVVDLERYVEWQEASGERALGALPFALGDHAAARSAVAQDMLGRMAADAAQYAAATNGKRVPQLRESARVAASLLELEATLLALQRADAAQAEAALARILDAANRTPTGADAQSSRYALQRLARQRAPLDACFIAGALLSSRGALDVRDVNPFVDQAAADSLLLAMTVVAFRVSRVAHAGRALSRSRALRALLGAAASLTTRESADHANQVRHAASALAGELVSRRHYVDAASFDPRFAVFEYIFDIMLRRRQVEIVRSFVENMRRGGGAHNSVQQMIMGAGKTTVVGPLLTLMLADGKQLVMHVMPSALLEQSRNVLRSRFAAIIVKRVYTLQFERAVDDSRELVASLFSKLDGARRRRGVVCAAPEAIKSLFLKFVEQLHAIEQLAPNALAPPADGDARAAQLIERQREQMVARSDMADAIVRVLDLWRGSVLVMDEVDVLLHPLRSELNYPISHKVPIDLAGARWDLPMHLLDAIFHASLGRVCDDAAHFADAPAVLREIGEALDAGYAAHALQRQPHAVLLDEAFYVARLQAPLARWALLWMRRQWGASSAAGGVGDAALLEYMCHGADAGVAERLRGAIEQSMRPDAVKLLNLAADWLRTLMPHVLSKIDRVSFGLLSPQDAAMLDPRTPQSRKLMAVPFVGKDVPSRSSEFAHPDALIGLTILAYRYEGMRRADVKRVVAQLKHDYSRQVGPRAQRPASVQFAAWLRLGAHEPGVDILPLALFQPNDARQLDRLWAAVRRVPELAYYFLRQHVFPATMNFQELKVSACGHELGSAMLFARRIGFSGTPSNLMPLDLGACQYEPGSDGEVLHVLTSPSVVTATVKRDWTARTLLRDVARAAEPVHALIDTGALITGMDNAEVAAFLLQHLPEDRFEGVVYLDASDRQQVLLRATRRAVPLAVCGLPPSRRFTFYDQVHTTGMDIKQAPSARAVLTLGKDMVFRDLAQGAYRMRGIGAGQTIELYVIPEVEQRIAQELGARRTGRPGLDVPAWLLVNSMRMESLQFVKLSLQELANVWRKRALVALTDESRPHSGAAASATPAERLRRFERGAPFLRSAIALFREPISFEVESAVPRPRAFVARIDELVAARREFASEPGDAERVRLVAARVANVADAAAAAAMGGQAALDSEVVHEQEAEAEEQAEEEAEQEEQRQSAFTRDDEQHNPWPAALLAAPSLAALSAGGQSSPFYAAREFRTRAGHEPLAFPPALLLSDNFFRPSWIGLGDRRLKNASVVLEWLPGAGERAVRALVAAHYRRVTVGCGRAACARCVSGARAVALSGVAAASHALSCVVAPAGVAVRAEPLCDALQADVDAQLREAAERHVVALSLAEAETLRRLVHADGAVVRRCGIALRTIDGRVLDRSALYVPPQGDAVDAMLLALRFFNCGMYYSDDELLLMERGSLRDAPIGARLAFFGECLRLRRRERHLWADTPLAKLFTPQHEWHLLRARAAQQQLALALRRSITTRRTDPYALLLEHAGNVQKTLEHAAPDFAPSDVAAVVALVGTPLTGAAFGAAFDLPAPADVLRLVREAEQRRALQTALDATSARWRCANCTYVNSADDPACAVCELSWSGRRAPPRGKWVCAAADGGCTFFNADTLFFCEVCSRARPDLAGVRL